MIIGIGSDLLDIRRIEKVMKRYEQRFIKRCFSPVEQDKAENRRKTGAHIDTYAKRFCAKEAMAKALGTGIDKGVYLKDISVKNDTSGKPEIELSGGAAERLQDLTPANHEAVIHVSMSDEPPLAQATILIEARPKA